MNWTEIIKPLAPVIGPVVGAVIGAIVAIAGIWVKDILDNRKVAQTWYEQTYITEGIDRLLVHLKIIELQLTTLLSARQAVALRGGNSLLPGVENLPKDESGESFPLEALVRVETLLKNNIFTALIAAMSGAPRLMSNIPAENRSPVLLSGMVSNLRLAYSNLEELREQLLQVNVKRKSDIHSIHKNANVTDAVKHLIEMMDKWVENTAERDHLISKRL